jgi:hypothetical protein
MATLPACIYSAIKYYDMSNDRTEFSEVESICNRDVPLGQHYDPFFLAADERHHPTEVGKVLQSIIVKRFFQGGLQELVIDGVPVLHVEEIVVPLFPPRGSS